MSKSMSVAEDSTIDIPSHWPGSGPLVLDVGCHRGAFLIAMAEREPSAKFLGIERLSVRVHRANARISRLGIINARAVRGDGLEVVCALPAQTVDAIHVLFPDPWPKRRHAPRRLVNTEFLSQCSRVLRTGGFFRFVTDDAAYAADVEILLRQEALLFTRTQEAMDFPETNFQKKFREIGKTSHEIIMRKSLQKN
jgi:tRNA (guanine-N7-)-methyltransferase